MKNLQQIKSVMLSFVLLTSNTHLFAGKKNINEIGSSATSVAQYLSDVIEPVNDKSKLFNDFNADVQGDLDNITTSANNLRAQEAKSSSYKLAAGLAVVFGLVSFGGVIFCEDYIEKNFRYDSDSDNKPEDKDLRRKKRRNIRLLSIACGVTGGILLVSSVASLTAASYIAPSSTEVANLFHRFNNLNPRNSLKPHDPLVKANIRKLDAQTDLLKLQASQLLHQKNSQSCNID